MSGIKFTVWHRMKVLYLGEYLEIKDGQCWFKRRNGVVDSMPVDEVELERVRF